jgi:Uma2 family endonuclease
MSAVATRTIPALESGDHLDSDEFHRRYQLRPDITRADLIDGVVYVPSPARLPEHGEPWAILANAFSTYRLNTDGISVGLNTTLRIDSRNTVQPDVMLRWLPERGGRSSLDEKHYVVGAPELIAEVAGSSAAYDLYEKKALYERIGVREYVVWATEDETISAWELVDGRYRPLAPDANGRIVSKVFPGLVIDAPRLLKAARPPAPPEAGEASRE